MDNQKMTGYPSIDKPWLKYYSQGLDKKPYKGSIYNHIFDNNKNYLEDTAIQYYGRKLSYAKMFENVDIVANVLSSYGIKKGDNVAILMLSCPELVYLILGLNKIGAVANMINPLFSEEQIRDRINDTESNLLIVLDQLFGRIENIQLELCVKDYVVIPLDNSMPVITRMIAHKKLKKNIRYTDKVKKWKDFITCYYDVNLNSEAVNDEELPSVMVYSSGTTGASKGIVLVNKGINATVAHYEYSGFEYKRQDSYLQIIPTWFSTGIIFCLFMPLCLGLSIILEPVFNEENFLNDILKYKPNMIMGPASLWLHVMKEMEGKQRDLSFVTYPITGGEKLLAGTEKMLNEMLHKNGCTANLVTGYGMCELGSTATSTSVKYTKPGTAGYPILGVTVAAFDVETDKECKYGERGEIRVLTTSRMKEYYKRPDATAEFFWKDQEGKEWGCTGDIGYVDDDGFVFIQGRASDYFVNKSGKQVYCFDLEDRILEIDCVYQCEVVGASANQDYEVSIAFVVLKEGTLNASKEIRKNVIERCAEWFDEDTVPVEVQVLDKFPVKGSGKRDMEQLKKMAEELLASGV